jgi:hypothetical protein
LVVVASAIYLGVGLIAKFAPGVLVMSDYYGWLCRFMPIPLLLVYFSMGGFKRNYKSDGINLGILAVTALAPILVQLKSVLFP